VNYLRKNVNAIIYNGGIIMILNVSKIKEVVGEIILMLDNLAEETGMEGDWVSSEIFSNDLKIFESVKSELDGLHNTDVMSNYIMGEVKKYVPSLDTNKLVEYIEMLEQKKESEIREIKKNLMTLSDVKRASRKEIERLNSCFKCGKRGVITELCMDCMHPIPNIRREKRANQEALNEIQDSIKTLSNLGFTMGQIYNGLSEREQDIIKRMILTADIKTYTDYAKSINRTSETAKRTASKLNRKIRHKLRTHASKLKVNLVLEDEVYEDFTFNFDEPLTMRVVVDHNQPSTILTEWGKHTQNELLELAEISKSISLQLQGE
jgi:hypothetical protein